MLVLAGVCTAIAFHIAFELRWNLLGRNDLGWAAIFFLSAPLVWLFFVLVFILLGSYAFRHTRNGYRHTLLVIIPLFILASLLLAFVLEYSPFDAIVENFFLRAAPLQDLPESLIQ